ncbi:hypothetical protein KIK15_02625 [Williamsia sp. CHRR-6]|nr:hypothetical protein [Williamsia sp. CHRR-6]
MRPERRTRGDLIAVGVIIAIIVVVGASIVYVSPTRRTVSQASGVALPAVAEVAETPTGFVNGWQADSANTAAPVVTASTVVTGDDGAVRGHDPVTGAVRWSYRRDRALCGVVAAFNSLPRVVAVYRNSRGCSETTALAADSGRRASARSSDADARVTLSAGSNFVVSQGATRLESWGSSLVRGVEYGRVSAPVQPGRQPRSGCELLSSATGSDQIAVIERCGDEPGYRLTIFAANQDKDEKVAQSGSRIITSGTTAPPPRVIAVGSAGAAVYAGTQGAVNDTAGPRVEVYGPDAALVSRHDVFGTPAPPADSYPTSPDPNRPDTGLSFFTGKATVILDQTTLVPRFQVPDTVGPATPMGADLLVPTMAGIDVLDRSTGRRNRSIPVSRTDYRGGTIALAAIGNTVVQLWGGRVHMLIGTSSR